MRITNLNEFLHAYFTAHQCEIMKNQNGLLKVQLTEDIDKYLMNRPFYWHYIKSIGQPGEPMKLTLITDYEKKEEKGELIHFGSPRLQQIIQHLRQNNSIIRLFQKVERLENTALYPWLIINIKISYQGKHKKDELFSIGLNLVNGIMKLEMMEALQKFSLRADISDYCYPISPLIKVRSGFIRIENVLESYVNNQEHRWAQESLKELEEEIQLVKHFYNDDDEKLEKEINEITERYTPRIFFEVINGGIIYLTNDFQESTIVETRNDGTC